MSEQTVDALIDEALKNNLIKNKTEGRKLKKAGLMELLTKHNAEPYEPEKLDAECAANAKAYAAEANSMADALAALDEKVVVVDAGEPHVQGIIKALDHEAVLVHKGRALGPSQLPTIQEQDWPVRALVAPEKNLLQPAVSDTSTSSRPATNILYRYGNDFRTGRGGQRRDKAKAKAARRARRKNRK
jgi:hypothetical protein